MTPAAMSARLHDPYRKSGLEDIAVILQHEPGVERRLPLSQLAHRLDQPFIAPRLSLPHTIRIKSRRPQCIIPIPKEPEPVAVELGKSLLDIPSGKSFRSAAGRPYRSDPFPLAVRSKVTPGASVGTKVFRYEVVGAESVFLHVSLAVNLMCGEVFGSDYAPMGRADPAADEMDALSSNDHSGCSCAGYFSVYLAVKLHLER
jgi:hypothetical protein